MIRTSSRSAFTLIELLIVIAIIAITVGGSMMALTGPMFERVRAEEDGAFESGAAVFFSTLVADAHRAETLNAETSQTLSLAMTPPTTGTIVYSINSEGVLTRAVEGRDPAKLLAGVENLTATQNANSPLWTISLLTRSRGYGGEATTTSRSMEILPGSGWAGGTL